MIPRSLLIALGLLVLSFGSTPVEAAPKTVGRSTQVVRKASPVRRVVSQPARVAQRVTRRPPARRAVQRRAPARRMVQWLPEGVPGFGAPLPNLTRAELRDSFLQGRSGGRTHQAIDIFRAKGETVVACADGTVRLEYSPLGGRSLYVTDDAGFRYYYAHLSAYAHGITSGTRVRRGDPVGLVGDTGNARGAPHLHFAIVDRTGAAVNPYPVLNDVAQMSLASITPSDLVLGSTEAPAPPDSGTPAN